MYFFEKKIYCGRVYCAAWPFLLKTFNNMPTITLILGIIAFVCVTLNLFSLFKLKQMNKVFAEASGNYRYYLDNSKDMFFTADLKGNFLYVNKAAERITGYFARQLLKANVFDLISSDYKEIVESRFQMSFKGAALNQPFMIEIIKKSGEKANLQLNTSVIFDDFGSPVGVEAVARDITSSLQDKKELIRKKEFLQKLLDTANSVILTLNPDQTVKYCNKELCQMLGLSEKEVIGKNWFNNFLPQRMREEIRCLFLCILEGVSLDWKVHENPILCRDGKEKIILWSNNIILDENGRIDCVLSIGQDITERRKIELQKDEYQKRFESAINSNPVVAIQGYDRDGTILHWNKASEKLYGFNKERVQGKRIQDILLSGEEIKEFESIVNEIFETGKPSNLKEWSVKTSDGKSRQVVSNMFPVFSEGKCVEVFCMDLDITELKNIKYELLRSEEIFRNLHKVGLDVKGSHIGNTNEICAVAHRLFGGWFVLVNYRQGNEFIFKAGANLPEILSNAGKERFEGTICSHVVNNSRPLYILDLPNTAPYNEDPAVELLGLKTYLGVPIRFSDGKVVGTLIVVDKEEVIWSNKEIEWLEVFAQHIAVELEEEELERAQKESIKQLKETYQKLEQSALIDALTGCFNYRYFIKRLQEEIKNSERYGHKFSLLALDMDYFKSINDVYGHQAGDEVLKEFSSMVREIIRSGDVLARCGGDEFFIIATYTDSKGAFRLAQKCHEKIKAKQFCQKDRTMGIKVKFSIGIVSYPENNLRSVQEFLSATDEVLLMIKQNGGDSVAAYSQVKNIPLKFITAKDGHEELHTTHIKESLQNMSQRTHRGVLETIYAFARSIEAKDHYTGEHVEQCATIAEKIAEALSLNSQTVENIKHAAVLHDLGKIGVDRRILLKPDKLSEEEWNLVKQHPRIGADILSGIHMLKGVVPLILYHHEHFDGSGYPEGLQGEQIPIGARIIAVADTFQALISRRPYRQNIFQPEEAINLIKCESGKKFDPHIANIFIDIMTKTSLK